MSSKNYLKSIKCINVKKIINTTINHLFLSRLLQRCTEMIEDIFKDRDPLYFFPALAVWLPHRLESHTVRSSMVVPNSALPWNISYFSCCNRSINTHSPFFLYCKINKRSGKQNNNLNKGAGNWTRMKTVSCRNAYKI